MSNLLVKRLVRESKKDPFKLATVLKKEFQKEAYVEIVRNRLRENNLKAFSPQKVLLFSSKHVRNRMEFATANSTLTGQSVNGEIFCGRMKAKLCYMVENHLVRM